MTTTLGQTTGGGGYGLHTRTTGTEARNGVRSSSLSLATVGLIALIASAWGGIVAFVGPTFGFSADGAASWHWDLSHAVLALIPGALGCIAALTFLAPANANVTSRRLGLSSAGIIGIASGAWFVVGPLAWPVLVNTHSYFVVASPLRALEYQIGYALGPGLILVMCSAFAMGWAARHNRPLEAMGASRDVAGTTGPTLVRDPVITPQPAAAPQPMAAPQPVTTRQPAAASEPAAAPQPMGAPQPAEAPDPPRPHLATEREVFGDTGTASAHRPSGAASAEPASSNDPPLP
jgi:hypothetical protein